MSDLRLTNRWSRRGCRRDEIVSGWEAALRVGTGAGHGPPRGSAPTVRRARGNWWYDNESEMVLSSSWLISARVAEVMRYLARGGGGKAR
jgi:hypothetical protein